MTISQDFGARSSFRATRRRRVQHDLPTIMQARLERDDPRNGVAYSSRV